MKQPVLTPAKGLLVMIGLGTIALMGLPELREDGVPRGVLAGVVRDAAGEPVADCRVALFSGDELALVEWTRTDERGRYAFHQAPWAFHVFAAPAPDRGLVGTWSLAREKGPDAEIELVLAPGTETTVTVTDAFGARVERAEVRVVDARGDAACVQRLLTDAEGRATVLCPATAHVGALGETRGLLSAWAFDHAPADGAAIELVLPPARTLTGRVTGADGRPLAGVLLSSWDERDGRWHWNGYRQSGASGRFVLPGAATGTWLRAVDPEQGWLPRSEHLSAGVSRVPDLLLEPGLSLEIRCISPSEGPWPSRVWVWSAEERAWSWGTPTDDDGVLRASVSERHAIVSEPLWEPGPGVASGERTYRAPALVLRPGGSPALRDPER